MKFFYSCFYPNIKNGFLFVCFSGLRFSDVKALTWGKLHTDSDGNTFISYTQKKTKKWENLPVSREAMKFVPQRGTASVSDLVFQLHSGGYENTVLKTWAIAAGINKKMTFHCARHTNATLLLSLEVPIETVSKILGHSDIILWSMNKRAKTAPNTVKTLCGKLQAD